MSEMITEGASYLGGFVVPLVLSSFFLSCMAPNSFYGNCFECCAAFGPSAISPPFTFLTVLLDVDS